MLPTAIFGEVAKVKSNGADSFSDKLCSKYTVILYALLITAFTTRVFVSTPITCNTQHHKDIPSDYIHQICWTRYTYNQPQSKDLDTGRDTGEAVKYHQWVTLFMGFQACCFYVPRLIWRVLNKKSGVAINSITDAAMECYSKSDVEHTKKCMKYMSQQIFRLLTDKHINSDSRRKHYQWKPPRCYYTGNYLVSVYLIIKSMYLMNTVLQLYILGVFLNVHKDIYLYGIKMIQLLGTDPDGFLEAKVFPRIILCNFYTRQVGNTIRHTVECVLPLNYFYEMMFIFLWFWIVMLACCMLVSLVRWSMAILSLESDVRLVEAVLSDMHKIEVNNEARDTERAEGYDEIAMHRLVKNFVSKFLRRDGCFIIKLVKRNTSETLTNKLICKLWKLWKLYNNQDKEIHDMHYQNGNVELKETQVGAAQRYSGTPNGTAMHRFGGQMNREIPQLYHSNIVSSTASSPPLVTSEKRGPPLVETHIN